MKRIQTYFESLSTHTIVYIFVIVISVVVVAFTLKGDIDTTNRSLLYQKIRDTRITGPFESTGSTSRFVLTKAIVERGSFFLNEDEARSAAPDLVRVHDKFISIFTPGVSLVAVPFYLVGQIFGIPQLTSYLLTPLVGIVNVILIIILARKLGSTLIAGVIGGITFLFATNAFAYAGTLTQHHLSTASILLMLILAFSKRNILTALLSGFVFGVAILFDIPNAFMLLPIILYIGFSYITLSQEKRMYRVSINFIGVLVALGALISLSFFGWYNLKTAGSFTAIGQTIGRTDYFDTPEKQAQDAKERAIDQAKGQTSYPFNTRVQLESSYVLLLGNERGWIYYMPVVFLGIVGFIFAYRTRLYKRSASLIFIVISTNIVIYSMFGDPWGGWAFGPRYLIPGAALLSIFISVALTRLRKNIIFLIVFYLLFVYSVYVNTLGAYTTTAIPPKGEAEALPEPLPYTYSYNQELADIDVSGSLLYNAYMRTFLPLPYMIIISTGIVSVSVLVLLILSYIDKKKRGEEIYE